MQRGVQLRKSKAWFGKSHDRHGFLQRGRYVAHNRYVIKVFSNAFRVSKTVLRQPPSCAASQIKEPAWPALVAVAIPAR